LPRLTGSEQKKTEISNGVQFWTLKAGSKFEERQDAKCEISQEMGTSDIAVQFS